MAQNIDSKNSKKRFPLPKIEDARTEIRECDAKRQAQIDNYAEVVMERIAQMPYEGPTWNPQTQVTIYDSPNEIN